MTEDRYERGWETFRTIDRGVGEQVLKDLEAIAPDMVRQIIEFLYGEVWSRPGLDIKTRTIATVAALTALGNANSQLKYFIHGSLNVGWSREEIIEVIMHMAIYAGFPAALNGMFAAKEVFEARDQNGES